MGYAYNDYCHSTVQEASQQVCANAYPVQAQAGGVLYVSSCGGATGDQLSITTTANGSPTASFSVPVSFNSCTWSDYPSSPAHLSPVDGAAVAAAIAAVWLAAWGWRAVYEMLRDRFDE